MGEGFAVNRLLTTDTPLSAQEVPEPATLGLVTLCGLGQLRRRRSSR
jgi:PEP-CTERM motif